MHNKPINVSCFRKVVNLKRSSQLHNFEDASFKADILAEFAHRFWRCRHLWKNEHLRQAYDVLESFWDQANDERVLLVWHAEKTSETTSVNLTM